MCSFVSVDLPLNGVLIQEILQFSGTVVEGLFVDSGFSRFAYLE